MGTIPSPLGTTERPAPQPPGACSDGGCGDAKPGADCGANVEDAPTSRLSRRRCRWLAVPQCRGASKPRASKKAAASGRPARSRSSGKLRRASRISAGHDRRPPSRIRGHIKTPHASNARVCHVGIKTHTPQRNDATLLTGEVERSALAFESIHPVSPFLAKAVQAAPTLGSTLAKQGLKPRERRLKRPSQREVPGHPFSPRRRDVAERPRMPGAPSLRNHPVWRWPANSPQESSPRHV